MKKFLSFLMIVGILGLCGLSMSSCTHEYTCKCMISYSGMPGLPDTSERDYTIQDTKQNAKDLCAGHSQTYTNGNITTREDCKLW